MYETISDLYYGKISPWERSYPPDSEHQRLASEYIKVLEKLEKALPETERVLLDEFGLAYSKMSLEQERTMFTDGFRLGVRLAVECLLETGEK
ncbi:MAG: hypothetical protein IJO91_09720 [Oscillospiraceae bacterium]|nr:hypothetical protein [Oscillospiraceae bacterium]